MTRLIGGPFSREQVAERLSREISTMQSHGIQYWPMFLLATGEHVGCCGLDSANPKRGLWRLGSICGGLSGVKGMLRRLPKR